MRWTGWSYRRQQQQSNDGGRCAWSRCDMFVAARGRKHLTLIHARPHGEMWDRPTSESVTAHDLTSQIVAQLSENSPLVTGKNKRVGVSSARLNPATRRGEARRGGRRRRRSARGPLLFSSSNSMWKRNPYKEVQLLSNFRGGTKLPTTPSAN